MSINTDQLKVAIYQAIDTLSTTKLDQLLAEPDATPNLFSFNELENLFDLLVNPSADKYANHPDAIVYCLRALLSDSRFPSPVNTYGSAMMDAHLSDERPLLDILQTWLDFATPDSTLTKCVTFLFDGDYAHDKLRIMMKVPGFNINDGFGHVSSAVAQTDPAFLRLLFEMPDLMPDRFAPSRYFRERGVYLQTPLNIAHNMYVEFMKEKTEYDDEDEPESKKSKLDGQVTIRELLKVELEEKVNNLLEVARLLLQRGDVDIHNVGVQCLGPF